MKEKVFLIYNPNTNLKSEKFNSINPKFTDYINYLSTSETFDSEYLMIIESCENDDICKYSYLEVYSEK